MGKIPTFWLLDYCSFVGCRFSSSCSTPGTVTVMFCISGYGLSHISGKGSVVVGMKADLN